MKVRTLNGTINFDIHTFPFEPYAKSVIDAIKDDNDSTIDGGLDLVQELIEHRFENVKCPSYYAINEYVGGFEVTNSLMVDFSVNLVTPHLFKKPLKKWYEFGQKIETPSQFPFTLVQ